MQLMKQRRRKMTKVLCAIPLVLMLSACGGKTHLVPQAYMPTPPEILMRAPKDLNTIKQEPKPEEKNENPQ